MADSGRFEFRLYSGRHEPETTLFADGYEVAFEETAGVGLIGFYRRKAIDDISIRRDHVFAQMVWTGFWVQNMTLVPTRIKDEEKEIS